MFLLEIGLQNGQKCLSYSADRTQGKTVQKQKFPGVSKGSVKFKLLLIQNNKLLFIISINTDSKITAWVGCKDKDPY